MSTSSAAEKLKIVVVGAGLGGLSAAISCSLAGHVVIVLEAAKELAEIGAGLQITPNASRLFKVWGIDETVERLAAEPTALTVHRYSDGKVLATESNFDKNIRRKYNAPFIDLHRADLHTTLVARARELGVRIMLDMKTYAGDLIVAADGLWSKCRECFLGSKDDPLPTGDLAYRIVLALDQVKDEAVRDWISKPTVHFWIGPNTHAVGYSVRAGTTYNLVLLAPDDLPPEVARQPGSVEEMKQLFAGWDPMLTRFLSYVDAVDKWKLMHRPELESWINEKGNFYLAQGANSSIEDGAVLGGLLGKVKSRCELKLTLELFQHLRKKRGEAIAREALAQRDSFHKIDGPEQEARDEFFASQLGKDEVDGPFPSRWTCPIVQPWLYGYDAYKEVETASHKAPKL